MVAIVQLTVTDLAARISAMPGMTAAATADPRPRLDWADRAVLAARARLLP